jgi:hypothetical protein
VTAAPDPGSFVLDENLSPQLAQALQLLDDEVTIRYIVDFFAAGTDDTVYLPVLGTAGAFLVTRDTKQRRKPAELEAYREHHVGAFILGGKNLERWDLVKQIVLSWPQIKETAKKTRRPFAYKVRANGGKLEPLTL